MRWMLHLPITRREELSFSSKENREYDQVYLISYHAIDVSILNEYISFLEHLHLKVFAYLIHSSQPKIETKV